MIIYTCHTALKEIQSPEFRLSPPYVTSRVDGFALTVTVFPPGITIWANDQYNGAILSGIVNSTLL